MRNTVTQPRACSVGFLSIAALLSFAPAFLTAEDKIDFNSQIRPLLSNRCFACHGPDEEDRAADLRLDTAEGALADLGGYAAVVPGDPDDSELYYRIITDDDDDLMPPEGKGDRFTKEEAELIARWIKQGGDYQKHWSYQKPKRNEIPEGTHPVDHFVKQRLAREDLSYSPEADRRTLARRLSLDLTGLPPTLEEVESFATDEDPKWYQNYVDRLLAKSAYGEHWARMWLDLARYADSAGYADDVPRTIWAWRDYVIRAFNENKPFDQFTIEQLAGDLLENPTEQQLIATAFHRNTQTNNEGGTNDEEFRNVAVVDRVNTTLATWMGTTMACANCHTHKYDPITHEDYFKVFAILNQTQDSDKKDERPVLSLLSDEQRKHQQLLLTQIENLEKGLATPREDPAFLAGLADWEKSLSKTTWHPLQPTDLKALSGANLEVQEDHSILASGPKAEFDDYSFAARSPVDKITAVKVELLADKRLPQSGPARGHNLVLNELTLTSEGKSGDSSTKRGRYVRIELPGKNRILHVAEVQVFAGDKNLATSGKATQSSTYSKGPSGLAIDGNTNGDFAANSTSHTGNGDPAPWWEVDLGAEHDLSRIVIWNRTDKRLQRRLDGFRLTVLDAERQPVWEQFFEKAPEREQTASLDGAQVARFARASASYQQSRFDAAKAIDGNAHQESGWAIAGGAGRNHHGIFELDSPLPGSQLKLRLQQTYPNHAIGRFRILVTDAAEPAAAIPDNIAAILATPAGQRSAKTRNQLLSHYAKHSPEAKNRRDRIAALRRELAAIKPHATVPIMREVANANRRKTQIHLRGSYLNHGPEVEPGFPTALAPAPHSAGPPNRMTLAQWLLSEENPLTARVAANRFWEKIFGIGIVATSEEFGSQGELPSHPELLDWLALEFVESGWDVKAFLKLLVTSDAYRQNSHVTDEMAARDPANRLLARGPRIRLTAEMVRDQALAVSGLLSPKMYGPPVRPPQPDLGIKAAFGGGIDWKTSEGEDKYRRGIYTTWRRSNPYPSMATFDAPNREVCIVRRDRTNTPLQALVTLNDPVYIEAAQSLARLMVTAGSSPEERLRYGFERCVSRSPSHDELQRLVQLYETSRVNYAADDKLAEDMATDPIGAPPEDIEMADLAALTLAANVLLNLDEMLMKR